MPRTGHPDPWGQIRRNPPGLPRVPRLGSRSYDLYRRAAVYVDKILKGTNPGELPLQSAEKFELVVNLRAAKALGLTISEAFLLRADEVIE
jgi:putative ABC transport system substrate-binding protein